MKILFSADWHVKLGQKNVPKDWSLKRFQSFFSQIEDIECDLHIIGGDLFDKMPNLDELQLFFDFVSNTKHQTLIYDGNHEATKKGQTFFSKLAGVVSKLNNRVTIVDASATYNIGNSFFNILPYFDLHIVKQRLDQMDKSMPLFTHVRGAIEPHVKPEIDLDLLNDFPVVFAGDLHSHSNTQRNIVYPGSPMTTSFHRTHTNENGYLLIDTNDWSWNWHPFKLPQLIRKTITDPKDAIPTDYDLTIYELEGSIKELSQVHTNELISSKKLTSNKDETTSILKKDMDLIEEFYLYATEILKVDNVEELQETLRDIIQKVKVE